MPLGDGLGRAGLQFAAPSNVSVGTSSTVVLSSENAANCEYIALTNDSDSVIYIGIGAAAELNKGVRLNSNGGALVFEQGTVPKVQINAITETGTKTLCVQTGS